jgi:hypothetical protein
MPTMAEAAKQNKLTAPPLEVESTVLGTPTLSQTHRLEAADPHHRHLAAASFTPSPPILGGRPTESSTPSSTAPSVANREDVDAIIREELKKAYEEAETTGTKPPNIAELPNIVRPRVAARGFRATGLRIKKIGKEPEFQRRRLSQGRRWTGRE